MYEPAGTAGCDRGCTSYAITPDASWNGDSHQLALAVGMAAVVCGHAVPPWALFSSDLLPESVMTAAPRNSGRSANCPGPWSGL